MKRLFKTLFFIVILTSNISCVQLIGIGAQTAMLAERERKANELKKQADLLGKNTKAIGSNDVGNSCRYFLYRRDEWYLHGITCFIYDNNNYVGFSERRLFTEVDSVKAGIHTFQAKTDSKFKAVLTLDSGKTYIIQIVPRQNYSIDEKALIVMQKEDIQNEMKEAFFKEKFEEYHLKINDF